MEVKDAINKWWKVFPSSGCRIEDLCSTYHGGSRNGKREDIQEAVTMAFTWASWKGRNEVVFKGGTFNALPIANEVQSLVYFWIRNRSNFGATIGWTDWICNTWSV